MKVVLQDAQAPLTVNANGYGQCGCGCHFKPPCPYCQHVFVIESITRLLQEAKEKP